MTTSLTIPFLLPADLLVIPVTDLAPRSRAKLDAADGDFAISRPRSRTTSSVVDADSADLLERFRTARTIVDAVVDFSRARSADPRAVLDGAFPVLERLIAARLLVPATDDRAKTIVALVGPGDRIGEFDVVRQIALVYDVELHQARSADGTLCLIKLARPAGGSRIQRSLEIEGAALTRLAGGAVPRLVHVGEHDGLPYLAIEWRDGVHPIMAGAEYRETPGPAARRALLALCIEVAGAYEALHSRGVAHGDVHALNVLVGRDGRVTLIDFGQAFVLDETRTGMGGRVGVFSNYDPELVAALLANQPGAPASATSEQYAVGTLLYQILTGSSYLELKLNKETALRQILEEPPLSFAARDVAPWPDVERILGRMMAKNPSDRFASLGDAVTALRGVSVDDEAPAIVPQAIERASLALFGRLALDGPLFRNGLPIGPHCSVNNGAAGIAHAWYRMALLRDDAESLAMAAAWARRAETWTSTTEAFFLLDKTITPQNVGRSGLFHSAAGIHCVRGLIAQSAGDVNEGKRSVAAFAEVSRGRADQWDLALGRAGNLLGAALLYEADPGPATDIRKAGDRIATTLVKRLTNAGSFGASKLVENYGMAHGWGGCLYALLRWAQATKQSPPGVVRDRLEEIASFGRRSGRGTSWSRFNNGVVDALQATWCNGDAGFIFLWLLAAEVIGDSRYSTLAQAAGWNLNDRERDGSVDLCCGAAGRGYAFLALYRCTGDSLWLSRAKRFAERAARHIDADAVDAHRLYKGGLGVMLLVNELEDPSRARMPVFEPEGWKWRHS